MELTAADRRLLAALADGLPLVPRPYAEIGRRCGLDEATVLERLRAMIGGGVIRRFGLVLHHHALGYRANAMVVFDLPEERLREAAAVLSRLPYVTLCYRRPRRPPLWPYNLFCMIHGKERRRVLELVEEAAAAAGVADRPRAVLFSRRRFKQRGPRYGDPVVGRAA